MSIRALYLINSDHPTIPLFSRKFPTVERRLRREMSSHYEGLPSDKVLIQCFFKNIMREELLQETLKHQPYEENIEIDHSKFELLLNEISLNFIPEYFEYYSDCPIVTLTHTLNDNTVHHIWPCVYIKKHKMYAIAFPSIQYHIYASMLSQNNNDTFISKKQYENNDSSFALTFALIDNLCNYIQCMKSYDDSKIQTLISHMLPFGSIDETNFSFMHEVLNFHTQSSLIKKTLSPLPYDDKSKTPGWVFCINKSGSEKIEIELIEELKYIKHPKQHSTTCSILLCDIHCKADFHKVCEVTLPITCSTSSWSCISNLRVHPCAKIEHSSVSQSARITFIPYAPAFTLCVSEMEHISYTSIPIKVSLQLKEANHNEVKIYLKALIDPRAIGKFERLDIRVPLVHFGRIRDTKIMVQVGEVSLGDAKTSLLWELGNKVVESVLVMSGTVVFKEEDADRRIGCGVTSEIRDNNCYCKVAFRLKEFSVSGLDVDKSMVMFYPKVEPYVDVKRTFYSNEFVVWNELSFNNYESVNHKEEGVPLLNVDIDADEYSTK